MRLSVIATIALLLLVQQAYAGLPCSQLCAHCTNLDLPGEYCDTPYPYTNLTAVFTGGPTWYTCTTGYSMDPVTQKCFRCDSSCASCSGTGITECITCRFGFTLNSTTALCMPPNNSTMVTKEWQYTFYGFNMAANWSMSNSNTGTSTCDSNTLLGGYSNMYGNGVITVNYTSSLPYHYQMRVVVAFYFLDYDNSPYNVTVQVDSLTAQPWLAPTSSIGWDLCNGGATSYYAALTADNTFSHSSLSAKVKFSTDTTDNTKYWGIREYVMIMTLCNKTTCATCTGTGSTQCSSCVDQFRQPYSGVCKCYGTGGNYFEDPTTKICIFPCSVVPTKYYGDPTTRKCVTKTTTPACPSGYFANDDNFQCVGACPTSRTLSGLTVYHDLTNRLCVTVCPSTEPYSNLPDYTCYSQCPNGRYRNDIDKTCVASCLNPAQTSGALYTLWAYSVNEDGVNGTCVSACPAGYYSNNATASCIRVCPTATPQFFKDNSTGVNWCVQTCPAPDFFGDTTSGICTQTCSGAQYGDLNEPNRQCVPTCTSGNYGYAYGTIRVCVATCPDNTWAESVSMTCKTDPADCGTMYADNRTHSCVAAASCSFGYYANTHTQTCDINCPLGEYGHPTTRLCQTSCATPYFADLQARLCVTTCQTAGTFADVYQTPQRQCVATCNSTGGTPYADNSTRTCVSVCNSTVSTYFADPYTGAGWICSYWCTPGYYADSSTSTPVCVDRCPANYYADNSTGTGKCVATCPVVPELFGDTTSAGNVCTSLCTSGLFGDQTAGSNRRCKSPCPATTYALSSNRRCVTNCQDNATDGSVVHLYGYNNVCYSSATSCPADYFGDDSTNLCVNPCPIGQGTFGDPEVTKKCVRTCPTVGTTLWYADPTNRQCVRTCSAANGYFGNNNTKTCVSKCIDVDSYADDQSTYRVCAALCSATPLFYYANNETKVCGISTACPTNYYGENTTQTCMAYCPTGTFAYATASVRICIDVCLPPTVGDTSSGHGVCVNLCPTVPMLWANLDPTIQLCVNPCPITGDWYGEDILRTCVQLCPATTYAYTPTRRCLSKCPTTYYADDTATVRRCWPAETSCTYGYGDPYLNKCVNICTGPTPLNLFGYNKLCVSYCPTGSFADSYTGTRLCVPTCPGVGTSAPNLYGDPTTHTCVSKCITVGTWADYQTRLCQSPCSAAPIATYSENIGYTCVIPTLCPRVPSMTFGENDTRTCTASCRQTPTVQYADPVSQTCVDQCQSLSTRWYGDLTTGSPICVPICPTVPRMFGENSTNLCKTLCPSGTFGDQTANRSCLTNCPTVSGTLYFSQDSERICVTVCKNDTWGNTHNQHCQVLPQDCGGEYADNSTHLCVGLCPESMNYFADPTTKYCVPKCPGTTAADLSFADYSTRTCVTRCPDNYRPHGTFGNNVTNTCEQYCTQANAYGDPQLANRYCVTACAQTPNPSFADPSTKLCVPVCPSKPNLLGETVTFTCVSACTGTTYADYSTRLCVGTCPAGQFKTTNPNTCVDVCPSNPDLYADTTGFCLSACTGGYFANSVTRLCVASCFTSSGLFQYGGRCTKYCPTGYYANANGDCVTKDNCDAATFAQNSTTSCVGTCVNGFADTNSRYCIAVCPTSWYADTTGMVCTQSCSGGKVPSDISNLCVSTCVANTFRNSSGVCSATCPSGTFADPSTWTCTGSCPTATLSTYGDTVNHLCVLVCPTGYYRSSTGVCLNNCNPELADQLTANCVGQCSVGYWGYNYVCVTSCPSTYYALLSDRMCYSVATLPAGNSLFADNYSGLWVATCPIAPLTFGDRNQKLCVAICPGTGYYADPSSRQCETACTNSSYFADQSTSSCVLTCPASQSTFGDPSSYTCVTVCTNNLFADNYTRRCVVQCPASVATFGYDQDWTCLATCPTGWFSYNITRMCVTGCPTPYFADSDRKACVQKCDTKFADISTRSCVASCALSPGYPVADNSTNECVVTCPSNPNYYASNHVCVLRCPSGQYTDPSPTRTCVTRCPGSTFGDSVSGDCVTACLPGYWSDITTNMCTQLCPSSVPSFADNTTGNCETSCAAGTFADPLTSTCTITCSGSQFAHNGACIPQCPSSFFANPLTKSCVGTCPAFGYSFGETTTQTCVANCSGFGFADNSTRQCVSGCPSTPIPGTYADPYSYQCVIVCPASRNLFMENSTQQCLTSCLTGYADNTTRFCVLQCFMAPELYADVPNKKCVSSCPTGTFADNSTNLCVSQCPPSPDYYADPLKKSCVLFCSEGYFSETTTRTCATGCTGSTFADNLTRSCVGTCPTATEQTYADSTTNKCVRICPTNWWAQNSSQVCVSQCPSGEWSDNISKYCVSRCPSQPLFFGLTPTNICVSQCPTAPDLYGDFVTQTCESTCSAVSGQLRYSDPISRTCVFVCPVNQSYFGDFNGRCTQSCSNGGYRQNTTQRCVVTCPSDPDTYGSPTFYCVRTCPSPLFASDATDRLCIADCTSYGTFADQTTRRCVPVCSTKPYLYADPSTYTCVPICPSGPDSYGSNKTQSCVTLCPADWNLFADTTTRTCVRTCPTGYFADGTSQKCVIQCPSSWYADPVTQTCVADCTIHPPYYKQTTSRVCVPACPTGAYKHDVGMTCVYSGGGVSGCPSPFYADNAIKKCVEFCPMGFFAEDSSRLCVPTCTDPEFADNTTRKCTTACSNDPTLYADPISQTCVSKCTGTGYYTDNITRSCVTVCSNTLYADTLSMECGPRCKAPYYAETSSKVCVPGCPTGWFAQDAGRICVSGCTAPFFGDKVAKACVQICPNNFWADTHTRFCQTSCSLSTEYRDNSTKSCVVNCPRQPFTFADDSTNDCVTICPTTPNYFGDIVNNVCVSVCPVNTFAELGTRRCVTDCPESTGTFADPVNHACQTSCPSTYFKSNLTRECVQLCPDLPVKTYAYDVTGACELSCPLGRFAQNASRVCETSCPSDLSSGFADSTSNICVTTCPIGWYAENSSASCVLKCQSGMFGDPTTRTCATSCPPLQNLFAFSDLDVCVYVCPNGWYADTRSQTCVLECNLATSAYRLDVNNSCTEECPSPYFAYVVDRICKTDCGAGYYGSLIDRVCYRCLTRCPTCLAIDNCTSCTASLYLSFGDCISDCLLSDIVANYKDNTTMRCVNSSQCPSGTYGLNTTRTCELSCPAKLYPNDTTKRCQACPATCALCSNQTLCTSCVANSALSSDGMCYAYCDPAKQYFYDSSCYATCPDGTYLTADLVTCMICSLNCTTCFGTATNCTICAGTFKYNGQCISQCPSGFYGDSSGNCLQCSSDIESCSQPVSFTVKTTVENYKNVVIIKFNQIIRLSDDLTKILRIKLKINKRLMQDLAALINTGIPFTYSILPDGSFKIILDLNTTLTDPTFQVSFSSPTSVLSMTGSPLQSVSNLIDVKTVQVYPPGTTSDSPLAIAGTILTGFMLVVFLAGLVVSPMAGLMSLSVFQQFYLHAYVNYTIPPNLFYFLKNLRWSMLSFLPNLPALGFTSPDYWQNNIPQKIQDLDDTINFCKTAGSVVLYLIVYTVLALLVKLFSTKCMMNRPMRNLFIEVYEQRVKFNFLHEVLWTYFLPVVFYGMLQFRHFSSDSAMQSFNLFLSVLMLLAFLSLPFIFVKIIYKEAVDDLDDNYRHLIYALKKTLPQKLNTFVYYIRNVLFVMFVVGPFEEPKAQTLGLFFLNLAMLIYLLVTRPFRQHFTNFLYIMHEIGLMGFELALAVYIYSMQNSLVASRVLYGTVLVGITCFHLTIAIIYAMFRTVIGYQALKQSFLKSEFYKLYIDDSYEKMVDKEIEEGLAKIIVDDKEGTIDGIEVKEMVGNTEENEMIKLRIKRRRKIKGSNKNTMKQLPRNDEEYERINHDSLVEPATLKEKDKKKQRHNIFDPVPGQESPERIDDEQYKKVDNGFMQELGPVGKQRPKQEFQRLESKLIQNVLAEKAKQAGPMVVVEIRQPEQIPEENQIDLLDMSPKVTSPEKSVLQIEQPAAQGAEQVNHQIEPVQLDDEPVNNEPGTILNAEQSELGEAPNELKQDLIQLEKEKELAQDSAPVSPEPEVIQFFDQQPAVNNKPAETDEWTQLVVLPDSKKLVVEAAEVQPQQPPSPDKTIAAADQKKRPSVFQFDELEMLMNDEAMNQFIEKDNKQPNKLANILFEDEES